VLEALRAGRRLTKIMTAETVHGSAADEIARLAAERRVTVRKVPRDRLDSLADHHQGFVAQATPYAYAQLRDLLAAVRSAPEERPPLLVALDALQDPQNFGNLLRTALAVGAMAALLPERRAVQVTPAVGRASAGAIERLPIARVGNLVHALRECKQAGLWVVGLDAAASEAYDQIDLTVPVVVVVGSEGTGLSRLVGETCDITIRLPMVGPTGSLNAAVAGSVVLYEALRQRRAAYKP
jgi:23S rRNA (guanosine2251-2'-O)-methyltransferase